MPAGSDVLARFHDEHQRRYGYHHAGRELEIVTLRLRTKLRTPRTRIAGTVTRRRPGASSHVAPVERVPVVFQTRDVTTPVATAVYERADLPPNRILKGPAVITEYSATTVVPPRRAFRVDAQGNLIIAVGMTAKERAARRRRN